MSIPSEVKIPVKIQANTSVGLGTVLGAGTGLTGLAGAALAYLLGDRTPETMAAIVGGVVTGVSSIGITVAGRYLQAHAAIRGQLQQAAGAVALTSNYIAPVARDLAAGDTKLLQGELAAMEDSLVARIVDRLTPPDPADKVETSDMDGVDDEAETTVLDAIGEPDPINARPEPKDPEAPGAPTREA